MTLFRVQRSVQGANGTTRDEYVNTFYFLSNINPTTIAGGTTEWGQSISNSLDGLWTNASLDGVTVEQYMSGRVVGPATYKWYDAGLTPSGPPIAAYQGPFWSGPDIQGLPEECSVCLSYNIIPPGIIPARARGRIYIGPLNIEAVDTVTTNDQPVRVNPLLMNQLVGAAQGVWNVMNDVGFTWCLYSRANGDAYPISNFSADDAFDTIRNRGTAPSVRISAVT